MTLVLRRWRADDVAALAAVADDAQLRRFTGLRAGEAERWLALQMRRHAFAVFADRRLAGHVVLKVSPGAQVGYWTAGWARGRGVAVRAVGMLTSWAWERFPALERIELVHRSDNEASCRVAIKSGFAYEERLAPVPAFPHEGHRHAKVRPGPAFPARIREDKR